VSKCGIDECPHAREVRRHWRLGEIVCEDGNMASPLTFSVSSEIRELVLGEGMKPGTVSWNMTCTEVVMRRVTGLYTR
jgi:hypothetical protein